jgi:hypothetical protein
VAMILSPGNLFALQVIMKENALKRESLIVTSRLSHPPRSGDITVVNIRLD